ncbi:hypothetical protein MNV49_001493 [Pseudohyphozyma bogoriensis]|nr:hypothetical protein MNV49_001493 [Pseudohyphozyma bogoriensis]
MARKGQLGHTRKLGTKIGGRATAVGRLCHTRHLCPDYLAVRFSHHHRREQQRVRRQSASREARAGGVAGVGKKQWGLGMKKKKPEVKEVVPTVDRTALEKLRLLEIHYGADEDASMADATVKPNSKDAPPLVASIPEPLKNPLALLPKLPASQLDAATCSPALRSSSGECLFLLPAWLGEQETKAQAHLYQLGLLALSLNRTLVLPPVLKSRLSTCYSRPFSFYYSPTALSDLGIPTISYADFLRWSARRDPAPSAQVVSMQSPKLPYTTGAIEIDSASDPYLVPAKPTRGLCLRAPKTSLDFSGYSPLAIYPPEGYHRTEHSRTSFGESVCNTLRSPLVGSKSSRASADPSAEWSTPNVLAFNYELRFPILSPTTLPQYPNIIENPPSAFEHFPYADTWTTLGNELADRLSPFVAIHWRTETLNPSNLVPCAAGLIEKLQRLQKQYPEIKNVYLATDYPVESLDTTSPNAGEVVAHSGTFAKAMTDAHHAAFKKFLDQFSRKLGGAKGMRLTSFAKEQANLELPEELKSLVEGAGASGLGELDSGLIGIVDKVVGMRAEVFVTGFSTGAKSEVCGKGSSFTTQIVLAREEKMNEEREDAHDDNEVGRGKLWNKVARWGLGTGERDDE